MPSLQAERKERDLMTWCKMKEQSAKVKVGSLGEGGTLETENVVTFEKGSPECSQFLQTLNNPEKQVSNTITVSSCFLRKSGPGYRFQD